MKWPTESLGSLCDVISGGTPKRTVDAYWNGEIPWVKISDVIQGEIKCTDETITGKGLRESPARLLEPGTLLMSIFATVGRTAVLAIPAATNQAIVGLKIKTEKLDQRYLRHYLDSQAEALKSKSRGVSQDNINTTILKSLKIPIPPLEEQRRIAAILDKADQLDKNRLSAIQSVDALQGSLFNEISNASMYPNKNLEQYRLSDLLEIPLRNGLSPSTEGSVEFSVLTLSAITRGCFKLESTKKGVFNSIPPREKTVNREDFLICRGNGNLNLVGLGEFPGTTDESTAFPDTMIAARLRHELVNPTYFATAWKQQSIRSQILGKSRTTNGTYKINQTSLESIVISLPSLERQAAFAGRVAPLRALAEKHESSMLARLAELKSSIIDHFLYGNQ
jgi:type I restriction enzyme S subunit